ncbi:MAG: arylamine N-acetyltransferase [Lachnospiraceae bacterium]|nr:arylamine N-acetyltransferase [Lachnospiraceae bacterium]
MLTDYAALTNAQVRGYLERLGICPGEGELPEPDLVFLNRLVEAHQKNIPFENIDVYRGKLPILLEVSDLYNKIVINRRGGYCFELNGLFVCLLRTLGYDAWSCGCRIMRGNQEIHPVLHRGNVIRLEDGLYFCDVGFGGPMPAHAVLLESGKHQSIGQEEYWPVEEEHGWWSLVRMKRGQQDDYVPEASEGACVELMFQTSLMEPADFIPLNYFVSEPADSFFRLKMMVNLRTDTGYRDISDMIFTVKENGRVTRRELTGEEERREVLAQYFGISL